MANHKGNEVHRMFLKDTFPSLEAEAERIRQNVIARMRRNLEEERLLRQYAGMKIKEIK